MRTLTLITFSFLLALFSTGCKKTQVPNDLTVFVSILPQKYFVEKIAGNTIKVEVLVSPGKNPHTYEPTPQQVMSLGNAKALFTIGVPFENTFLPKIQNTLTSLRIVDTSIGITKRTLESHDHHEGEVEGDHHESEHHDEEKEDEHHEDGVNDPHIWLSPSLVKIQARTIYNTLIEINPDKTSLYTTGYETLINELDVLIADLKKTLSSFEGSVLFVFHPSFGYFADEFGLKQVSIEKDGKETAPAQLIRIIEKARKENVKIIFAQPEFSRDSAQKIGQAINGTVVILNPLHEDYSNNLRSISLEIEKSFK